jgi:hypothetical protein
MRDDRAAIVMLRGRIYGFYFWHQYFPAALENVSSGVLRRLMERGALQTPSANDKRIDCPVNRPGFPGGSGV